MNIRKLVESKLLGESLPIDWRAAYKIGHRHAEDDAKMGKPQTDEYLKQVCIWNDQERIDSYIKGYHKGLEDYKKSHK